MRNKRLSQVLALILALMLVFSLSACGGESQEGSTDSGEGTETQTQTESGAPTPANVSEEEWIQADEDGEAVTCDFGIKDSGSGWTMEGAIAKLDYEDLSSQQDAQEAQVKEALEASGFKGFELESGFEEGEEITKEEAAEFGIDVGDIVYISGAEDDDMENRVIEVGTYNNPQDDSYYQYFVFSTETFKSLEEASAEDFCKLLEKAFGVTADVKLINEGFETAYNRAANYVAPEEEDTEEELSEDEEEYDYDDEEAPEIDGEDIDLGDFMGESDYGCGLQQIIEAKGDGYTDTIYVSITGQKVSTDEASGGAIIYASVERDRKYD